METLCLLLQCLGRSYVLWAYWFRRPCILGILYLSGSYPFCTPYHKVLWVLRGGIWWRYFSLSWALQCLSLCIVWLWFSGFVCFSCSRKLLWWWLSKALICDIWFYSRSLGYVVWGSWSPANIGYEFYFIEKALSQIRYWLFTPTSFWSTFH